MRRSPRIFPCIALVVILTAMAALPQATAMTRRERRLLHMVNHYRAHYGLARLHNDAGVAKDAHRHSARMARVKTLFHTQDLESVVGRRARAWGENVAKARGVYKVFKMWRRSAGHRANMLNNRYKRCGVGLVRARGYFWATMIYYG